LSKGYYAWMVFLGGCSYGILSTIVKVAYEHGISVAEVCGAQGLFWHATALECGLALEESYAWLEKNDGADFVGKCYRLYDNFLL